MKGVGCSDRSFPHLDGKCQGVKRFSEQRLHGVRFGFGIETLDGSAAVVIEDGLVPFYKPLKLVKVETAVAIRRLFPCEQNHAQPVRYVGRVTPTFRHEFAGDPVHRVAGFVFAERPAAPFQLNKCYCNAKCSTCVVGY